MKQETELLIPAKTGNRTIKMYTSSEKIFSVDHWPPKRKVMQLIIIRLFGFYYYNHFDYSNYFSYLIVHQLSIDLFETGYRMINSNTKEAKWYVHKDEGDAT